MTERRSGAMLLVWLAAPLAALPAIGWALTVTLLVVASMFFHP
ncbi:MAG TPA: hypothetical protein VKA54_05500 [Gemmatimonadaceae bacterium]|nr:hypothetical protein [Gemmatimonadaceae bacterium]